MPSEAHLRTSCHSAAVIALRCERRLVEAAGVETVREKVTRLAGRCECVRFYPVNIGQISRFDFLDFDPALSVCPQENAPKQKFIVPSCPVIRPGGGGGRAI